VRQEAIRQPVELMSEITTVARNTGTSAIRTAVSTFAGL
jgi:hypothetical protein